MKKYKLVILTYFLVIAFLLGSIVLAFYQYDPLQIFHKAQGRKATFNTNMRQQAAGIINNYSNYNSIILGTCLLENTSSKEAGKKLGGKFINISIADGSYYERSLILRHLFRKQKIERIMYSLDPGMYYRQQKEYSHYPLFRYDFLYDSNPLNDISVYFNDRYFLCLLGQSKTSKCIGNAIALDRPNAWFKKEHHQSCYGGLGKWLTCSKSSKATREAIRYISDIVQHIKANEIKPLNSVSAVVEKAKKYIDKYILSFVDKEVDTHFILIDPPYSRIQYAIWAQYNRPKFEVYKAILKYLARKSDEYSNLEVYSFGEEQFIDDIANYKDLIHYHYSIDSWMLSEIATKRGLLNSRTIDNFLDNITKKALDFNLLDLGDAIKDN